MATVPASIGNNLPQDLLDELIRDGILFPQFAGAVSLLSTTDDMVTYRLRS